EELIAREHPEVRLEEALAEQDEAVDPYQVFRMLLLPLERVKQNPKWHPEGDVLYHLLQVFELAREERPWDEEFLLAALLHDVGKGIDPSDHVGAALQALDGLITPRTAWLIEHHMLAQENRAGTLGRRQRQRLEASDDFDDLMLLRDLDDRGRGGWMRSRQVTGRGPIVARTSARYRQPLSYPALRLVGVRAAELQSARVALEYRLVSARWAAVASDGQAVVVSFDYRQGRKA